MPLERAYPCGHCGFLRPESALLRVIWAGSPEGALLPGQRRPESGPSDRAGGRKVGVWSCRMTTGLLDGSAVRRVDRGVPLATEPPVEMDGRGPAARDKLVLPTSAPKRRDLLCGRCGKSQLLSEFRILRRGGYTSSWCRSCHLEATREWRARNRDAINAARRAAYVGAAHPVIACAYCGTTFQVQTSQSRYCTRKCNRAAYRARRAA
jgi:hypothetical protein